MPGLTIPPSGFLTYLTEERVIVAEIDAVSLVRKTYYIAEGSLPDPMPGVVYVVSGVVRTAFPTRTDLASPGDPIRGSNGRVIGCMNLLVN